MSGPYTGTWDSSAIGTLSDDGYEIRCTIQGQEVNETDAYGQTLVEAIYRGQNWRALMRGLEWEVGLVDALQMFGQSVVSPGDLLPALQNIGDRWSRYCKPLVLTRILGDPPSVPLSLTATNAGLAPQMQAAFNMTSKVRELPLEMVFLPYAVTVGSSTKNVPFTTI